MHAPAAHQHQAWREVDCEGTETVPFTVAALRIPVDARRRRDVDSIQSVSSRSPGVGVSCAAGNSLVAEQCSRRRTWTGRAHGRETPVPAASSSTNSRDQAVRAARHIQRKAQADEPVTATAAQRTAGLATIYPAIKPWGTVYVDDREIGVTPALKSFEVPPGRRLIIIKTSSLPACHLQLSADPEAEISVTHDFACISDRERPCREGFGKGLESGIASQAGNSGRGTFARKHSVAPSRRDAPAPVHLPKPTVTSRYSRLDAVLRDWKLSPTESRSKLWVSCSYWVAVIVRAENSLHPCELAARAFCRDGTRGLYSFIESPWLNAARARCQVLYDPRFDAVDKAGVVDPRAE
jgi:hypothetical protein